MLNFLNTIVVSGGTYLFQDQVIPIYSETANYNPTFPLTGVQE